MHYYLDTAGLQDFAQKLTVKNKTLFAAKSLETDVEELRNAVGSPLVAEAAADMTDTDKIYVYVGSETGYTSGSWYYYDGSEWQSGGVYNSTAFVTDTTLAVAGMAADAKAAGDAITTLENADGADVLIPITGWQLGTLSSTGVVASTYRAFSGALTNNGGKYQFDATKYKLAFAYFDSAESTTRNTLSGWHTESPATNDFNTSYPYVRLYIEELSKAAINVDTDITINEVAKDYSTLVAKVLTNESNVADIKAELNAVYVSTTGSDDNDGTQNSPFATIQKAVDSGAEIIRVFAGTYAEFSVINRKHPLKIMLAEMPTYSPSATEQDLPKIIVTGASTSPYHGIIISNCEEVYLSDIHVTAVPRYCYNITDVSKIECVRCYASNNSVDNFSGFRLVNVNGVFRDCKAWNLTLDGFNIHGYGNTEFINCVAYNCGDDGLSHHDSCTGCIVGGEFYGCGKAGIASPYGGASVDISGAYSHDNTRYGLYADSDDNHPSIYARISDCLFVDNAQADIYIADGTVVSWNTLYKTKSIQTTGTFTEYNNTVLS